MVSKYGRRLNFCSMYNMYFYPNLFCSQSPAVHFRVKSSPIDFLCQFSKLTFYCRLSCHYTTGYAFSKRHPTLRSSLRVRGDIFLRWSSPNGSYTSVAYFETQTIGARMVRKGLSTKHFCTPENPCLSFQYPFGRFVPTTGRTHGHSLSLEVVNA